MSLIIPDISHFEHVTSFHAMKDSGVPAFITKATQGVSYTDPTFDDYMERGCSVGLIAGAYAFLNAAQSGLGQAEYFLEASHLKSGDLQPIVDAEALGLTKQTTVAALDDLTGRGYDPILYASISFFQDVLGSPTDWSFWMAAYRSQMPTVPKGVTLFAWQFTDHGTCAGVSNPCDLSHFYGTVADLNTYCIP